MRRSALIAVAGGLALAALAALTTYVWLRPNVLRLAVVSGSEDHSVMIAAAQMLARERAPLRFRLIPVETGARAAELLEAGGADLAVIRTDIALPKSAQTAIILHRNAAVLITPAGSKLEKVADLRGRTVAVVRGIANTQQVTANDRVLDIILRQYDIAPESVSRIPATLPEIADVIRDKRADAIMAVGVLSSGILPDVVANVARAGDGAPNFIAVTEADAIAQRLVAFEALEVVRGVFGGAPPKPAKSFETLGFTTRLFARNTLKDAAVGDVTRFFFTKRTALAEQAPLAERIEAPSTEKGSGLSVHPGAAAYLDGEEEGFFDKYGDVFYIGAMLVSVIGSGLAAMASRMGAKQTAPPESSPGRLLQILMEARSAPDEMALGALEAEVDACLGAALSRQPHSLDAGQLGLLTLAMDQARAAIAERRRGLSQPAHTAQILPTRQN